MKSNKRILLYILSSVMLFSCITIEKDIEITGEVSWEYWKKNAGWSDYGARDFFMDYQQLDSLKARLATANYSFIVFATAFCTECEEEVPKIYRVFAETGVGSDRVKLIGLDKSGEEPSGACKKHNVKSVPLVIVFRDGVEIGRTVGSFSDIIEKLLNITDKK